MAAGIIALESSDRCVPPCQDFRAMLQLCEAMHANVVLRFERAGDPLVVGPYLQGDAPVSMSVTTLRA